MSDSLISIILPTFNQGSYLRRAILSVINQSYENWELIIVDNYSSDETEYVVKEFPGNKIKYYKFKNDGVIAKSRNLAIRKSQGEWIAFLDSDDYWLSNKLSDCINLASNDIDFIYHDLRIDRLSIKKSFNEKIVTRQVLKPALRDLLVNGNLIGNASVLVRRNLIDAVGGLDESPVMVGSEDYNCWLKIATLTENFLYIPRILGVYLVHDKSVSRKDMEYSYRAAINPWLNTLSSNELRIINSRIHLMKVKYFCQCNAYLKSIKIIIMNIKYLLGMNSLKCLGWIVLSIFRIK